MFRSCSSLIGVCYSLIFAWIWDKYIFKRYEFYYDWTDLSIKFFLLRFGQPWPRYPDCFLLLSHYFSMVLLHSYVNSTPLFRTSPVTFHAGLGFVVAPSFVLVVFVCRTQDFSLSLWLTGSALDFCVHLKAPCSI